MKDKILTFMKIGLKVKSVLTFIFFIFLIPIACSFILGNEMREGEIKNIPTIIVDHDNSSYSQMLIKEIKNNEIFNVTDYSQDDYDVKKLIENNKVRVGVIIPQSFAKDLTGGNAPKVLVFYDGSQMSITSAAKSRMDEILLSIKTGYIQKVMQGKLGVMPEVSRNYMLPMYFNYRLLNNPARNYSNFLNIGMLISVVQVCFVMLGADLVRKEKHYVSIWIKTILGGLAGAASTLITLGIQVKYFGVPFRGTTKETVLLTILFCIAIVSYGVLIRLIVTQKILSIQIGAVTVLPTSILGGYTFPLLAMPPFFQSLSNVLPFVHYAGPMRRIFLNGIGPNYINPEINWFIKFILCMWVFSLGIFYTKKAVKSGYNHIKNKKNSIQNTGEAVEV
ncbi:ABC transporter permease [Clostridium sp. P21]|uniref:ABC transporter permease n=1 Tax=Clostridium muellerianum TaxID=2716538 RepID=A0A7Y0EKC1_9CLOT|nr:ABC transporter permease [Clostridium muellerianum]NMM65068.1 ABC transporter permease [Clostridium muellerianum]